MININDSKAKIKYQHKEKPAFRTEFEREKYWDNEKKKWIEGYSGLSGMHYYYIQEGWIKDGTDGTYIRPNYRDCDEWIINELHHSFWNFTGTVGLIKRREIGATSIGAGLLPFYTMRLFTGSTFGITSCDQGRIGKAFSDKTTVFLNEMDADIRPEIDRKNETKSASYLRLAWKTKNEKGHPIIQYSDLYAKETTSGIPAARGFSGTRMRAAYFDEFPLHPRRNMLLGSSLSCFMKGSKQEGLLFWAGTCEEGLSNKDIFELQQLCADSEHLNTKVIFAPGWWGLHLNAQGESNEKTAVDWITGERDRYAKLEDKSFLNAFIKNYPLSLDEIFGLGAGSFFEDPTNDLIKAQLTEIAKENIIIPRYTVATLNGKTDVTPSTRGKHEIFEHPKQGIDYITCVDGTGSGSETGATEGSKVASVVFKLFDPGGGSYCPVCIYHERPTTVETSYINIISQCKYYDKYDGFKKIVAEGNIGQADAFASFLTKEGLAKWIQYRKDISGKAYSNTKKPFQYITGDIRDWQIKQMNLIIRRHVGNYWMKAILIEWLKPASENCDLRDATLMFPIYMGHSWDKPVEKKVIPPKKRRTVVLGSDGISREVWITIGGDENQNLRRGTY